MHCWFGCFFLIIVIMPPCLPSYLQCVATNCIFLARRSFVYLLASYIYSLFSHLFSKEIVSEYTVTLHLSYQSNCTLNRCSQIVDFRSRSVHICIHLRNSLIFDRWKIVIMQCREGKALVTQCDEGWLLSWIYGRGTVKTEFRVFSPLELW